MTRQPDTGTARALYLSFRATPAEAQSLDAKRGSLSRSEAIRQAVAAWEGPNWAPGPPHMGARRIGYVAPLPVPAATQFATPAVLGALPSVVAELPEPTLIEGE